MEGLILGILRCLTENLGKTAAQESKKSTSVDVRRSRTPLLKFPTESSDHQLLRFARPFIPCLYFVYARKINVRTHVKRTRQWKSTLKVFWKEQQYFNSKNYCSGGIYVKEAGEEKKEKEIKRRSKRLMKTSI